MRALLTCQRGVAAVEFAIILAAMTPAMITGVGLSQKIYLSNGTQFAAFASAVAGSRALAGSGDPVVAAQNVFNANKGTVFLSDVEASIDVQINGVAPMQTVTVTVTATEPLFIPVGPVTSISSTMTATD